MKMPLYRVLLRLFPRDMRQDFGRDMEELFARQDQAVRGIARARLWLSVVADAARHGLGARFDRRSQPPPTNPRLLMDLLSHDVRYALRMLLKQPAVASMMLATLALGIGANTAVFSVVHAVLLRPLPYADPSALVMVYEKRAAEGVMNNSVSPADFLDWQALNRSFTTLAAYSETTGDLTGAGDPVQVAVGEVTAGFFDTFGIRASHGRTFAPGEDVLGRDRVVVLGYGMWQQRFGGDPAIVGRSLTLDGAPHEVVGVLPAEFEWARGPRDVWTPLVLRTGVEPPSRTVHYLDVFARLRPGVTLEAARTEMDAIGRQLAAQYPDLSRGHGAHVAALREEVVTPVRGGLWVLALAVAFVLMIACTNVANLLLARGAVRRRELAIRAAIGAARSRLLRQSLTESVVLAVLGGLFGLGVAMLLLEALVSQTPPVLRGVGLQRAALDLPVLGFAALLCIATGVGAGVVPAWLQSRDGPADPLREGGRAPIALNKRIRLALVVAEVSLTSLLLVGAGLMLRSFERVLAQPAGLDTANRLVVSLTMPRSRYGDAGTIRRAGRELESRLRAIPGIVAVGSNDLLPLTGRDGRRGITVEGLERRPGDSPVRAHLRSVTPGYFGALGIKLVEGRGFSPDDTTSSLPVVIVNETMARRYWPDATPIGKRVRLNGDPDEPWREVVGVIGDVRHWGLDAPVNPEMYLPFDQQPSATFNFVLLTRGTPPAHLASVARVVQEFDPNLPIAAARTMVNIASGSVAARRWTAVLLASFGGLALVLAAVGIYGVMAQIVASRTSEIGIRLSLGAKRSSILRQVMREGLLHTIIGLALGLALALTLMRGLRSLLFDVTPSDPLTLGLVAATLLAVAGAACLAPARRAMNVDPVEALRTE